MSSLPRVSASGKSRTPSTHPGKSPAVAERNERLGPVSEFIARHYRHFNAASLNDAALAYIAHLESGGSMMMALAGAMSTAELGVSLAEMIRRGKVHAVCCTGANLEEDVFNLVAHSHYERLPHYRDLTPQDEQTLLDRHLNRVTDTCIPEHEAMRRIENVVLEEWKRSDASGERLFPHEFLYRVLLSGVSTTTWRSIRPTAGCSPRPGQTCRFSCPDGKIRRLATSTPPTASRARSRTCTPYGRALST